MTPPKKTLPRTDAAKPARALTSATPLHTLTAGQPWPLGASFDGQGVNFAVFSANAQAMDLCIFNASGSHEVARLRLPSHSNDVWHGYLPGAQPGLIYGLRAHGRWRPDRGLRFDAAKLLLDPYARDIVGSFDRHDKAHQTLKARVTVDTYDWADDRAPTTPLADSVIYECHVKGFSKTNEAVPAPLRGTYAGMAHPASINHLKQLGVTAVCLQPVHYALSEERLRALGLVNYWGYNTIGFFCVDPRLASGDAQLAPRDEFRNMVKALHAAGLEVILDVVFNHSAESDENGPTISFKGLDNPSYYRLPPEAPSFYENHSGCGNTLNIRHPRVLQMVMDSLRYWVGSMHVDGFRFDLAPTLGRGDHGFDANSAFFGAVSQDPVLSRVKLIAEPWDTGPGGYQLGGFPRGWLEWNDQFRDSMRGFWVQTAAAPGAPMAACHRGDFARRLCGSSDIYQARQRAPAESINFVVSHDGFTLRDLLSYNQRHNLQNGENNRDGHGHNFNYNCGAEGPTTDPAINRLRARLQRVLIATPLVAQGTPMLCAGDELGHTQLGNNNAYCQDNPTTWIDWSEADADLIAFTAHAIAIRREVLPFGNTWYTGQPDADGVLDVAWLQCDGTPLQGGEAWRDPMQRLLGCHIRKPGKAKAPVLLLFNADSTDHPFALPEGNWQALLDTRECRGQSKWTSKQSRKFPLAAHSLAVLGLMPASA